MSESLLKHHPVGQAVPDTPHAVCCSLPTMKDVVGYEEKHPETMQAIRLGYPRFVPHCYLQQVAQHAGSKHGFEGKAVYALTSVSAAKEFEAYVQAKTCSIAPESDFVLAAVEPDVEIARRAKAFTQHTGLAISSRQAEDYLLQEGLIEKAHDEKYLNTEPEAFVKAALRQYIDSEYIGMANSGMNAFYGAFKAVSALQRAKGKTVYLQIGWLYLDTQKVLEEFLQEGEEVIALFDVFDTEKMDAVFEQYGERIAAVVTELPTNPLVQTLDVVHLSERCQAVDAVRIFDPTISSVANVNVLPYTDVLVTSLTKYASGGGDVMIGAYALNPKSPYCNALFASIGKEVQPPYIRDLKRLAYHIQYLPDLVAKMNENTKSLAAYLESHPAIKRVYWSYCNQSADNYQKIAVGDECAGSMITVELAGPLEAFYNRSTIVKGPSFGTYFTMMCPFMYLAHYDYVSKESGRQTLKSLGLDPDLIRISVGVEPLEEIIAALRLD